MRRFGEAFTLTLLTDDSVLAKSAYDAGVDRIGLDLERLGKAERQAGHAPSAAAGWFVNVVIGAIFHFSIN